MTENSSAREESVKSDVARVDFSGYMTERTMMVSARRSAFFHLAAAGALLITGMHSVATAQTLLPPEGLNFLPSPTVPTTAEPPVQLAPPTVDFSPVQPAPNAASVGPWTASPNAAPSMSNESSTPASVVFGDPIYLDENGNVIPNPEASTSPVAPPEQQWDLHGFAPLPATQSLTPGLLGPQFGSPSVSTWQPVKPKATRTRDASAAAQQRTHQPVRTPSAARVWRAMGRLR